MTAPTPRFCEKHHSWLCGYGEGKCQKGDLWAVSGSVAAEPVSEADGEGSES